MPITAKDFLLARIRNPERGRARLLLQRAVIEPAAISQPVSIGIEPQARHQQGRPKCTLPGTVTPMPSVTIGWLGQYPLHNKAAWLNAIFKPNCAAGGDRFASRPKCNYLDRIAIHWQLLPT